MRFDGFVDDAVFSLFDFLSDTYGAFNSFLRRFRVFGWKKAFVEVLDEGMTFGVAGLVLMLALAQPAFRAAKTDWRAQDDYSVTFLDRAGNVIGRRGILQNKPIDLAAAPDYFIKATLATEDRRFFTHFGVDFVGTARALRTNIQAQGVVEGGSTITQQVAKNLFLSNERTLTRKITEAFMALWLEYNLTKNEILGLYFDRAYLGGGAFGIPAAAEFYYGKDYRDLTLSESAILAGLFKAPANYAPHINLPAARARANEVLTNLVQAGMMTEGQVLPARQTPASAINRSGETRADYFLDWAFDEVKKLNTKDRVLTVVTSIDPQLQRHAQRAIVDTLAQESKAYRVEQAATVVMTPDGFVRAMVGGKDYGKSQFNRAAKALRQPGSSWKPFVYAAAMEEGYSPKSVVRDGPIYFKNWSPKNYNRSYAGPVSLTTALVKSINTVPVRLAHTIGRSKVLDLAAEMGITAEVVNVPSMPLGASGVSVLDMTTAYSTFANGGFKVRPKAFLRVISGEGEVLVDNTKQQEKKRILSEKSVASMNEIMHQIPEWGTGRRAKLERAPTAGKTGTTSSYRDAWFVGYTGDYVAAVWYGNDTPRATNNLTGGRLPAMTWKNIMDFAHVGIEPAPIPFLKATTGQGKATAVADLSAKPFAPRAKRDPQSLSKQSTGVLSDLKQLINRKRDEPLKTALAPVELRGPSGLTGVAGQ